MPTFAAGYAELRDCDYVWRVTLELLEADMLDLTPFGYGASAVATALASAGIAAPRPSPGDADFPPAVVRAVQACAVRDAGYRAIRMCDSVDWSMGAGR